MVAKITFPKRVEAALNYNERKVHQGKALCLGVSGYLSEHNEMNFYQKLAGLEQRNALNHRATTKTIHVSLNFDPSEQLSDNRLEDIARRYMEKIGFDEQPFLIYKHEDAGHPHMHIVSTTIQENGRRINTHNIGRNQSEKARKELEILYRLMKAEKQKEPIPIKINPVPIEKVVYGKQETKQGIATIIGVVFQHYKFASLPEYNAVLKQFNIVADRGKEAGRIYKNGGLIYRLLHSEGLKIGVPIKASSISGQPTLKNLERKFTANVVYKEALKPPLKNKVDRCLATARTMADLTAALHQQNVYLLLRQNAEGRIYGITFVDNATCCVFNGSDLGNDYAAAAIQSRLLNPQSARLQKAAVQSPSFPDKYFQKRLQPSLKQSMGVASTSNTLFNNLLSANEQFENMPGSLLKKKRKKKKRAE